MNVDSLHIGFSQLLLLVTASIAGTFHSPVPVDSPNLHVQKIQENTTYQSQQIITPAIDPVKNVLGIEMVSEKTFPVLTPSPVSLSISTPSPTSIPTSKPSPAPTQTITKHQPEVKVSPKQEKQEITLNIPPVQPIAVEKSLNPDILLQLINQHRAGLNLPPLVKDEQLCRLADYRKPQLYDEIFTTGSVHKGLYDLNLPYFITENMAHYASEQAILNWWLGSPIHRAAIEGNSTYSCGSCAGNSCAQLFTNYIQKN